MKAIPANRCFFSLYVFIILIKFADSQPLIQPMPVEKNDKNDKNVKTVIVEDTVKYTIPIADSLIIESMNFKNADIRDVLRGLGAKYKFNIWIAPDVLGTLPIQFSNIKVKEAIDFIITKTGFRYRVRNSIVEVYKPQERIVEPPKAPVIVEVTGDKLSVDLQDASIDTVVSLLVDKSGFNIMIDKGASGAIRGKLKNIPVKVGIKTLFESNGFDMIEKEGVLHIAKTTWAGTGDQSVASAQHRMSLTVNREFVTMQVVNLAIADVIKEICNQSNINIVVYGTVPGTVSAKLDKVTVDDALQYLLRNTAFTYWKSEGIYFLGDKSMRQVSNSELFKLKHIKANDVIELLPKEIATKAAIKVIKEQNAVMAIGEYDILSSAKEYIAMIDQPIPQILLEALVVDFSITKMRDVGLKLFTGLMDSTAGSLQEVFYPDISAEATGDGITRNLGKFTEWAGIKQIVRLPSSFRARLSMLEREGVANVISTPQIATLNGNTASIAVGTTQYFLMKSSTVQGTDNPVQTETERFETVEATVSLAITPWATSTREVTVEVNPVFQIPGNSPDPGKIPPTINKRELKSTIRLKNGETFILGGLVETTKSETMKKVPFLGNIPFLGALFRSKITNDSKNRLMIFLTPHIYYGSEGAVDSDEMIKKLME